MKIIPLFLLSAALGLVSAGSASAADVTAPGNLQFIALKVVAPDGGKDNRSYCWKPGVTVSVTYAPTAGKIVKFNENDSKIDTFTDDKGTDLMAGPPSQDPFNKPGINYMSTGSEGGESSIILDLKSSGQPAKGAATFTITGKLNLQIVASTNQFTADNVAIKTNASFSLGDLPVVISEAGTNQNPWAAKEYHYSITISSLRDMDSISTLDFYDAQGHKVDALKRSWGGGFLGSMIQYDLKQNLDHAKIVATCWQRLQTIDVPFTVKTGAGL